MASTLGKILPMNFEIDDSSDELFDHGEKARREGRFVFETAWEVANKGKLQVYME